MVELQELQERLVLMSNHPYFPYIAIPVGAICLSITVSIVTLLFAASIYRKITHKSRPDKDFHNGFSILFQLRMIIEGLSVDNMFKVLSETVRNRLYAAIKPSLFQSEEVWLIGHPALVRQVFGPSSSKHWSKADQAETLRVTMQRVDPKKKNTNINRAMLYTGDDDGWKHARQVMTPFFYKKDFSTMDRDMDRIIKKRLDDLLFKRDAEGKMLDTCGNGELLNMTLEITIDLVLQLLYGKKMGKAKFDTLVKALAGYIVPGSPALTKGQPKLPFGMSCFEYHRHVGKNLGKKAPDGTLAAIIRDSDLPDLLKQENLGFFLEALTPAFASFWVICHALLDKTGSMTAKCKDDPVYRQQCIKEALRMYPPVPALWPRVAQKDIEIPNPLYDERTPPKDKPLFGREPIENGKTITIQKGTVAMVLPSVLHYDERFWFAPKTYSPERWANDPFVLEQRSNPEEASSSSTSTSTSSTAKINSRKTVNYGGLLSTATEEIKMKKRDKLLEESREFYSNQKDWRHNIRNYMFGDDHEAFMSDSSREHLTVCTDPAVFEHHSWSFMPFGLGMHACMGRRLALRMVDAILYNFLNYNVTFYNGMVPSMFTSKDFHERIVATAAVYNMPADPAYISLKLPERKKKVGFKIQEKMRVSIVDHEEYRKSGIGGGKSISEMVKAAMDEPDSDSDED